MFRLTKQEFIALLSFSGSLTSVVNIPGHTKRISLNNQQCMTKPTLINLHPNESIEGLRCYSFAVNLDIYIESCNTMFIKFISCECKSQFDDSKCNSNQEWNDDKCCCE